MFGTYSGLKKPKQNINKVWNTEAEILTLWAILFFPEAKLRSEISGISTSLSSLFPSLAFSLTPLSPSAASFYFYSLTKPNILNMLITGIALENNAFEKLTSIVHIETN